MHLAIHLQIGIFISQQFAGITDFFGRRIIRRAKVRMRQQGNLGLNTKAFNQINTRLGDFHQLFSGRVYIHGGIGQK